METEAPSPDYSMPAGCSCDMRQNHIPTPAPLDVTAPPTGVDQTVAVEALPCAIEDAQVVAVQFAPSETEASVNSPPLYLTSCTFLI